MMRLSRSCFYICMSQRAICCDTSVFRRKTQLRSCATTDGFLREFQVCTKMYHACTLFQVLDFCQGFGQCLLGHAIIRSKRERRICSVSAPRIFSECWRLRFGPGLRLCTCRPPGPIVCKSSRMGIFTLRISCIPSHAKGGEGAKRVPSSVNTFAEQANGAISTPTDLLGSNHIVPIHL